MSHTHRWDRSLSTNKPEHMTYLEFREHVAEEHPELSLYLRNDVLAERHRRGHEEAP